MKMKPKVFFPAMYSINLTDAARWTIIIATTTTKVSPYQTMTSIHKASQPFCVDLKKKNLRNLLCRLALFYTRIKQIIVFKVELVKSRSYKDDSDKLCKLNAIEIMKILKAYSHQIRLIPVTRRKFPDSIQKNSVLALTTLTVCWPIRTFHSHYHNLSFMRIKDYNMICGPNNSKIFFRSNFDKIMTETTMNSRLWTWETLLLMI